MTILLFIIDYLWFSLC